MDDASDSQDSVVTDSVNNPSIAIENHTNHQGKCTDYLFLY